MTFIDSTTWFIIGAGAVFVAIIGAVTAAKEGFFDDEHMSKSERNRFDDNGQYIDYSGRGLTKRKRKTHKKSHKKRK